MGLKSKERRASVSLLCAQTHESPFPSHAVDTPTTSAAGARKKEGEGEKNHNREPLHQGKQRNQTTARRAYRAKSGGDCGGWRRRRGDARRGTSRRSVPCRTNALARSLAAPPRLLGLGLGLPFPPSLSSTAPRLSAAIRAGTLGAEGGRGSPILACARSHGRIDHEGCPHDAPRRPPLF